MSRLLCSSEIKWYALNTVSYDVSALWVFNNLHLLVILTYFLMASLNMPESYHLHEYHEYHSTSTNVCRGDFMFTVSNLDIYVLTYTSMKVACSPDPHGAILPRIPHRPHSGLLPHLGAARKLHHRPAGPLPALHPCHQDQSGGTGAVGHRQVVPLSVHKYNANEQSVVLQISPPASVQMRLAECFLLVNST